MFIYKNKRTGVEISTLCPVSGEWELVSDTESAVAEAVEPKETKPKRKRTVKK